MTRHSDTTRARYLRRVLGATISAAVVAVALVSIATASDPPHWTGVQKTTTCGDKYNPGCHLPHASLGDALTNLTGNANLCQSCHNATDVATKDLAINTANKASMSLNTGLHHAWDVNATNASAGASTPANPEMSKRLATGNIVCSTCHNQHAAVSSKGGPSRIGNAHKTTALGSVGGVTSGGTFTGTAGLWYLIEIQTAGAVGVARFRWSKDNGVSWFGSNVLTAPAATALDNGVTVAFTAGNLVIGERWEFSASWPFLRATLDAGDNATGAKFCRDCHSSWDQTSNRVEGNDGTYPANGTNLFSHPVGEGLAHSYDRTATTILDGTGVSQSAGDGNPGNDLKLDATNNVQCWSCHAMHYAPSNSTAVIP